MLSDFGGAHWLVVAAVALIVIGPKDLPPLLRKLGQAVAKLRGMASEFRMSFDEMARHSELEELRREVNAMRADRFELGADALSFQERQNTLVAADAQSAALDAGATPVPVTEPAEPTLFDFEAPPTESPAATVSADPAPHEPGATH